MFSLLIGGSNSSGASASGPIVPAAAEPSASNEYPLFESGQIRPLAISPSGSTLLAVNTHDNRLGVFQISAGGLAYLDSVPVGMEPVATRTDTEVWVANHV